MRVRSVPLEYLLKEQAGETPGGKQVIHWKRKALLPPLIFSGLSLGLIISGFLLILYSPVPLNFIRWYGGVATRYNRISRIALDGNRKR